MNLSAKHLKALRSAVRTKDRRGYPDFGTVFDLVSMGLVAQRVKTITILEITDTGKQALKDWEAQNEIRI